MNKTFKYFIAIILIGITVFSSSPLSAGNKDRSGQAGASELLINPWARSAGWGGVSIANAQGLEAIFTNVAGTAFTKKTELIFSNTSYLKGTDINLMAFGFSQRVGESSVFTMTIQSMEFGEIDVTTINNPDPSISNIGTFSPSLININLAYAKAFSSSIFGGINVKIISESISDMSAQGIAIDAGIQYVTGELENVRFGIALKNVGPPLKFSGDGLSVRAFYDQFVNTSPTYYERSDQFELPTLLSIGAAYDFLFGETSRFTLAGAFLSNAFSKDQFIVGGEFSLKNYLMLRAGYTYEDGMNEEKTRTSVFTGPSAGLSVQVPFNKKNNSTFSIDYSYVASDPFQGSHTIGARINL